MAEEAERYASIWDPIEAGESVQFGPGVVLDGQRLTVGDDEISLNTPQPLSLDDQGASVVQQIGAPDPLLTIDTSDLVDVDLLLEAANRLVQELSTSQRPWATGWPPGSIGDVSTRIGYDVRDLKVMGYSGERIHGVLARRVHRGGLAQAPAGQWGSLDPEPGQVRMLGAGHRPALFS